MIERLRRSVRAEDVLLAIVLVVIEPVLGPADPNAAHDPGVADGLLGLVALLGADPVRRGRRMVP